MIENILWKALDLLRKQGKVGYGSHAFIREPYCILGAIKKVNSSKFNSYNFIHQLPEVKLWIKVAREIAPEMGINFERAWKFNDDLVKAGRENDVLLITEKAAIQLDEMVFDKMVGD